MPKILEPFSWTFDHFRLFKSSGRKVGVQKPITFSEANKMKFYSVLSHFAKYRNLRVKVLRDCPKERGGGVQPNWAMPVFRPFFLKKILL